MFAIKVILAFLYDFILLFAVWFAAAVPFVLWQGADFQQDAVKLLSFQVYLLAVTYFYLTYFWMQNGQTPGLRVWHLRLVDHQGYCLSRSQANLRFLLGILLFGIGWVTLFTSKRQTLQDILAHTHILPSRPEEKSA